MISAIQKAMGTSWLNNIKLVNITVIYILEAWVCVDVFCLYLNILW